MRLENRVALVFGAGSSGPGWGNGKAAAVTYAREGARVVAIDVSADAAEETAGLIREEGREALRKAGFYAEWKKKYGDEAWAILEKAVGSSLS